ncbi:MAG: hypothetical protein M1812_005878 [Candelaria pacifica]|nr:MAG: hypothetical protein M1812_005878 [Candelaria pacifica]
MASLIPLTEIPTLSLLYKLNRLQPTSSTDSTPDQSLNNKISLIRNDITKLKLDSIVNAANESLLGGGGVDGAIHRAAGPDLLEECRDLDGCDTGDAKITDAYELPCRKVIHAVGPIYYTTKKLGKHTSLLQGCYRRSLELAVENGLKSIAFSALSTGVYGYPSGEAAETAIGEVKRFLEGPKGEILERVVFCSFEKKDESAYEEWIPKFFPPTEQDIPSKTSEQSQDAEALADKLPSPPKADPVEEGLPDAKKLKTEHAGLSEDWEAVEPSGETAENGPPTTNDEDAVMVEKQGKETVDK